MSTYQNAPGEGPIITEILQFLKGNGVFAWRNYHTGHFNRPMAVQNIRAWVVARRAVISRTPVPQIEQGIRDQIAKCFQKVAGSPKGQPDIFGVVDGKFLAVEVKAPGDKLSPEQEAFLAALRRFGAEVYIATDASTFIHQFSARRGWGQKQNAI